MVKRVREPPFPVDASALAAHSLLQELKKMPVEMASNNAQAVILIFMAVILEQSFNFCNN